MTAKEAQTLIRYTGWASRKILAAVEALPLEQRCCGNGISHQSIEGTVNHIFLADRLWLRRTTGAEASGFGEITFDELRTAWPEVLDQWQAWADGLTDADAERVIAYKLLNGSPGESTASQIVTHLVNHATLHRGQVMGMIRQLGVVPPATDILWFYRETTVKM
jgi:uncharacterized damage-inducible protein DinB